MNEDAFGLRTKEERREWVVLRDACHLTCLVKLAGVRKRSGKATSWQYHDDSGLVGLLFLGTYFKIWFVSEKYRNMILLGSNIKNTLYLSCQTMSFNGYVVCAILSNSKKELDSRHITTEISTRMFSLCVCALVCTFCRIYLWS